MRLAGIVAVLPGLALIASLALAAGPDVLAGPDEAGPDAPPAGHSLLREVFEDGVPFPFEAVLKRLQAIAGPQNVQVALIPLGRSLQRYAAFPDFFASPRLVLAVTGDRSAGPDDARLSERFYLGYQPVAEVIEAITYNEVAGRFEFEEIVGYGASAEYAIEPAGRAVCVACHQGQSPIFARPLWDESNASTAIAARMSGLGQSFLGAPVEQSVDALEAFDAATDRAARIGLASRLWAEGCPDNVCRAELLVAALRYGLAGGRPGWQVADTPGRQAFLQRTAEIWPEGLAVISPDLPNRDPLREEASPEDTDPMNPETPRAPVLLWQPAAEGFETAAVEIAAQFSSGDFDWIDALFQEREGAATSLVLACKNEIAPLGGGGQEIRFACTGGDAAISGFYRPGGAGRIIRLKMGAMPVAGRMAVRAESGPGGAVLRPEDRPARLADGRRLAGVEMSSDSASVTLVEEFSPLELDLAASAAAGAAALEAGPLRRRALLELIKDILRDGSDG